MNSRTTFTGCTNCNIPNNNSERKQLKEFRAKHFSWKHLLTAFVSQRVFPNYTYTIRHGLASGMRRKGGLGFLPVDPQETAEIRFLRKLAIENKVVYDIGAFEGVLTMFFARKARLVVAFEPNPRNHARCVENVDLNELRNVIILNRGVSDRAGTIELIFDPLMPGAGSAESAIALQIDSSVKTSRKVRIPVAPLDEEIASSNLREPDLIKIDIEGMELKALQGMRRLLCRRHPELFIEMHGATAKEKKEIAEGVTGFLAACGYRCYDVEGEQYVTAENLGERLPGHLYCAGG